MAIITLARQVAALGDEVGAALAEKLGYQFITRKEIEKRILDLGFDASKMPKYDERKPGFFASLTKARDEYFNITRYAILEAAAQNNVVIIGRGAFAMFDGVPNHITVRLVADDNTRLERLEKEFDWNEKQARQRIQESDENRNGFHKNFYNVDVDNPANFDMVLNTGKLCIENCCDVISGYLKSVITEEKETAGVAQIKQNLQAQTVVNKLVFEHKVKIEFLHAAIEETPEAKTFVLYGVTTSNAIVEQALQVARKELPGYEVKSCVSIVSNYKNYQ